ncbi:hypothetical protein OH76DRAFT_1363948 [Lentinus brumalis]|uniref:HTH CENPB-type domain-containing protein n=1 Tax=Lentinus brumalis TaxID=2498619 RepID=A0A371CNA2_9APHY|nr:hypothetical protein OH76DRAFT_1363948 [Polyporus brumalis]
MPAEPTKHSGPSHIRKARDAVKPYNRTKPTRVPTQNAPKTSATLVAKSQARNNLTLHDWLTIVAYCDSHPNLKQKDIVEYFRTRAEGALTFNQASLSRHLSKKGRTADQARLHATPAALDGKCVRAVTRPDVEKALFLWTRHMEEKKEHYSGAMLAAKRTQFEEAMGVPEKERMKSDGWIAKFCKA